MTMHRCALLLLGLLLACCNAMQALAFDPSPNPGVRAIAQMPDGKILIGGAFTTVDGIPRARVALLNEDGDVDTSFVPIGPINNVVQGVIPLADNKILISGAFEQFGADPAGRIARLNPDGTLDISFNSGTGANAAVESMALQPDGKIVIGGQFTEFNGVPRSRIARLNADGSLDMSFDPGTGPNNVVRAVLIQPDGKIVVGGSFTQVAGFVHQRLARLNSNGSLDSEFVGDANNQVWALALQPDGKIVIGGWFTGAQIRVARLNPNGSLDTDFNPGAGANNAVESLALQADGKILLGGGFNEVGGQPRNSIARLNSDGSLDADFDPNANVNVVSIKVQPDGKILAGGDFSTMNGVTRNRFARLHSDGTLERTAEEMAGASAIVETMDLHTDGRVLVAGSFTQVGGVLRNRIARLAPSLTATDVAFDSGTGANDTILAIAQQPDSKILIGGQFTEIDGHLRNRIARLNQNGSFDSSFDPGTGAAGNILALAVQSDGKIIVGGAFTTFNGQPRRRIVRLNADGSVDADFDPNANNAVRTIRIQPDGKILIGGSFTQIGGVPRSRFARLNANGTLDADFNPNIAGNVFHVALQPDGKILAGGSIISAGGIARTRLVRLEADGTLDVEFSPEIQDLDGSGVVRRIALQSDGKIVIVGAGFISVNGESRNRIARLHPDGSLDANFNPNANRDVQAVVLQPDGMIGIGGDFTRIGGTWIYRIARLNPDGSLHVPELTPELEVLPAILDFGSVEVGETSAQQSVTLSSVGDASVEVLAIDGAQGPFVAAGGDCPALPFSMEPAQSCTLTYAFAPEAVGSFDQTVAITSNNGADVFELNGEGIGLPGLSATPGTLDFGGVELGEVAAELSVVLHSSGSGPVTITGIDAALAPFNLSGGDCPAIPFILEPNQSCTVGYGFEPTAVGSFDQVLSVSSNADPASFELTGEGFVLPGLSVTPGLLDFGTVETGASVASQSVTLTSSGSGPVAITGINAALAPFVLAGGDCPATPFSLAPGENCTLAYGFEPVAVGQFAQSIDIANDAGPVSVELAGTSVDPPPQIHLDPEHVVVELEVGNIHPSTVLIGNAGVADLLWSLRTDPVPGPTGLLRPLAAVAPPQTELDLDHVDHAALLGRSADGAVRWIHDPLAMPFGGITTVTHSNAPDQITAPNTIACGVTGQPFTTPNQFLRAFALPGFGINTPFRIEQVQFAIEELSVAETITVNLYTLSGSFVYANLSLLATVAVDLEPQQTQFVTVPITAEVPPGATLVAEIVAPDLTGAGRFFLGSNSLGESAPSYIAASGCGIHNPASYASIGFPQVHLLISVTGHVLPSCVLPTWLELNPEFGTVAGGEVGEAELSVDATGLPVGTHDAVMCIESNDPNSLVVTLPVTAEVTQGDAIFLSGFED